MQTEKFVTRLLEVAANPGKVKHDRIVRTIEDALRTLKAAGPNGEKAIDVLESRIAKRVVRRKLDA